MGNKGKSDPAMSGNNQNARDQIGPEQAEVPMGEGPPMSDRHAQLLDQLVMTGTAAALAQSLKVMADAEASEGAHGHAVICRRAERYVRLMHMHVTRLLVQPDLRLRHPSLEFDLKPVHVDVSDLGAVMVSCSDVDDEGWHTFPLDELMPAGPVNDMVRVMVQEMGKAVVQDAIGRAIEAGQLPGFDQYQWAMQPGDAVTFTDVDGKSYEGVVPQPTGGEAYVSQDDAEALEAVLHEGEQATLEAARVHNLQTHPEYVMGEDPHTEPVPQAVGFDAPEGDEAFGENGS